MIAVSGASSVKLVMLMLVAAPELSWAIAALSEVVSEALTTCARAGPAPGNAIARETALATTLSRCRQGFKLRTCVAPKADEAGRWCK